MKSMLEKLWNAFVTTLAICVALAFMYFLWWLDHVRFNY